MTETETLPEFMNRAMLEGQPFEIYLTLTSTTAGTFTLDSTSWDWNGDGTTESAPFAGKELIITGLSYEATIVTGSTFDYITIDGIECTPLDLYNRTSNSTEVVRWDGFQKGMTYNWIWPVLTDHYCVPLVCRHSVSCKLSDFGQGDSITVRFRGIAIDRHY
jgi:hypothetical protein